MRSTNTLTRLRELMEASGRPEEAAEALEEIALSLEALARERDDLQEIVDVNPSLIFAKDAEGRFTRVNRSLAEAFGLTAEEILGRTDRELCVVPEEVDGYESADRDVFATGRPKLIPLQRWTVREGGVYWLQTIKVPLRDASGRTVEVLGIATDVTARHDAEERHKATTRRIIEMQSAIHELALAPPADLDASLSCIAEVAARTLDVARLGIWLYSGDRQAIVCEHLHESDGGPNESEKGLRIERSTCPRYFTAIEANRIVSVEDAVNDARTSEFAVSYLAPKGISSLLDVGIRSRGEPIGIVCYEHAGAARDWSPEEQAFASSVADLISVAIEADKGRQLEAQLRHSQKMEAVGVLAGGVAHDFNNLLSVILGFGDMAMRQLPAGHEAAEDVRKIVDAAERASDLTGKLLTFSRKQVVHRAPMAVSELISEFGELLDRIVGEDIEVRIDPLETPVAIDGDRTQIEQVLLNLCTNARQAMPYGGMLQISAAVEELSTTEARGLELPSAGKHLVIVVRDSGEGIPESALDKIWDPFFTTKRSGTGLGLSMVRKIVDEHGGAICAESRPGRGATFIVRLPVVDGVLPVRESESCAGLAAGTETILVAEDEPLLRDLVRRSLTGLGYEVLVASNGAEALERFARHREAISAALLDVVMPDLGGPETFQRMRAESPGLKVVFTSGYAPDTNQLRAALAQSDVVFVRKPFRLEELVLALRQMLDGERATARGPLLARGAVE